MIQLFDILAFLNQNKHFLYLWATHHDVNLDNAPNFLQQRLILQIDRSMPLPHIVEQPLAQKIGKPLQYTKLCCNSRESEFVCLFYF